MLDQSLHDIEATLKTMLVSNIEHLLMMSFKKRISEKYQKGCLWGCRSKFLP